MKAEKEIEEFVVLTMSLKEAKGLRREVWVASGKIEPIGVTYLTLCDLVNILDEVIA